MSNPYYIYVHVRLDTNEPFYIGRGKGNRKLKYDNRNQHWINVVKKAGGFKVYLLKVELTHEQANYEEIKWIKVYKENGAKLVNITDGGGGVSGHTWKRGPLSFHHRKILSSKKQGKMNGPDNPFFGKHHTEASKEKFRNTLKLKKQNEKK